MPEFSGRAGSVVRALVRREVGLLFAVRSLAAGAFDSDHTYCGLAFRAIAAVCLRRSAFARSVGAAGFCNRRGAESAVALRARHWAGWRAATTVAVCRSHRRFGDCEYLDPRLSRDQTWSRKRINP